MKDKIRGAILLFIAFIAISSCTIEKRRYQSGYYINWGKHGSSQSTAFTKEPAQKVQQVTSVQLPEATNKSSAVQVTKTDVMASSDNSFVCANTSSLNCSEKKTEVQAKKISKYKAYKTIKKAIKNQKGSDNEFPEILMILLCIFLPPLAVGIMTDWELEPVAINFLLCLLCWLPGIVHAFFVYDKSR